MYGICMVYIYIYIYIYIVCTYIYVCMYIYKGLQSRLPQIVITLLQLGAKLPDKVKPSLQLLVVDWRERLEFSNALYIVTFDGNYSRVLTFQNLCQAQGQLHQDPGAVVQERGAACIHGLPQRAAHQALQEPARDAAVEHRRHQERGRRPAARASHDSQVQHPAAIQRRTPDAQRLHNKGLGNRR